MTTEILPPSPRAVAAAAELLRGGEVVALPTETVYGLAGNAFDEAAVTRIFTSKERPSFDPLIVHVLEASLEAQRERGIVDLSPLDSTARDRANLLSATFWPGPLTLVLPVGPRVPGIVTSGLDTVAVRSPRHSVFREVLAAADTPLAAPSANRFGRISPTRAGDVLEELGGRIRLIVDGGPCSIGVESTVVRVEPNGRLTLLRAGGTPAEAIAEAAGVPLGAPPRNDASAPGRLESHYAPGTPLRLLPVALSALSETQAREAARELSPGEPVGVLVLNYSGPGSLASLETLFGRPVVSYVAARSGTGEDAARALFRAMRELDRTRARLLLAEPVTRSYGVWPAVAERLAKAASVAQI